MQKLIIQLMNIHKTSNIHITWHWCTFMQPLLLYKAYSYYISLFWASVVALVTMHHITICGPSSSKLVSLLSQMAQFLKKILLNIKCVSIFSTKFVWNISHFKNRVKYGQIYTECPRRNVPHFGRMFLTLKYTDVTQNSIIQIWTVQR